MLRTSRKSSIVSSLPSSTGATTTTSSSSSSSNSLSSLSHHKPYPYNIPSYYWKQKYVRRQSLSSIVILIMMICVVVLIVATIRHGNNSRSSSSSQSQPQHSGDNRLIMTQQLQQQQQQQLGPVAAPLLSRIADYDVIICGSGPAGLTAGIFAARIGLQVLITGSIASSQLAESVVLENFPSSFSVGAAAAATMNSMSKGNDNNNSNHNDNNKQTNTGEAWLLATQQQAAAAGVQFAAAGLMVSKIERGSHSSSNYSSSVFTVVVEQHYTVTTRSIILATGATSRRLELPYETQLWGRALHSCAICDGPSYQDRTVVVVGGGDAAVEAALLLAQHAAAVVVVHRRNEFRASDVASLQALRQLRNVHIETPFRVVQYETNKSITTNNNNNNYNANPKEQLQLAGVTVENVETKTTKTIPCDGVFVMIGSSPNTQLVQDLVDLDPVSGLVVIINNSSNKGNGAMMMKTATSVPGIFAAGQVTDDRYKQAITAAAAGAQAALDAERWLRQQQQQQQKGTTFVRQHRNKHISPVPLQTIRMPSSQKDEMERALSDGAHETVTKIAAPLPSDCNDLTKQECISTLVKTYPVVVFSKPWCGYCRRALEKLALEGVSSEPYLYVVDLSAMDNFRAIQNTLHSMTGRRTVPNVFIGGTSIGGGDETVALSRDGKLRPLLEKAGALPQQQQGIQMIPKEQQHVERPLSNTQQETTTKAATADCSDFTKHECITALVNTYPVVVFSISWCNKCRRALEKLAIEGVSREPQLHVVNLDMTDSNHAIQNTLSTMTGRHGVPYIFIGGTMIGGSDELTVLYRDGKLRPSLENAGALPGGAELCNLTEEACIAFVVQKYPVVVFSKHYCPYCKRALEALKLEGLAGEPSLRVIDLTKLEHGADVQNTLQKMTGRRTVPNVFVGGTSIGGGDETYALHRTGKLKPLLVEAHAFEQTDAFMS